MTKPPSDPNSLRALLGFVAFWLGVSMAAGIVLLLIYATAMHWLRS